MVKQLRLALGISQKDMAEHLGISRSHLAMIETGKRDLPLPRFNELGRIYMAIQKEPDSSEVLGKSLRELPAREAKKQEFVQREIKYYRYRIRSVEQRIEKLKQSQERHSRLFNRMETVLAEAGNERDRKFLELMHLDSGASGKDGGEEAIHRLDIQKFGYEAILKHLEEQVDK